MKLYRLDENAKSKKFLNNYADIWMAMYMFFELNPVLKHFLWVIDIIGNATYILVVWGVVGAFTAMDTNYDFHTRKPWQVLNKHLWKNYWSCAIENTFRSVVVWTSILLLSLTIIPSGVMIYRGEFFSNKKEVQYVEKYVPVITHKETVSDDKIEESKKPIIVEQKYEYKNVIADELNVRNKPSIDGIRVGTLKEGTTVRVIKNLDNGWTELEFGVFAKSEYLR